MYFPSDFNWSILLVDIAKITEINSTDKLILSGWYSFCERAVRNKDKHFIQKLWEILRFIYDVRQNRNPTNVLEAEA